MPVHMQITVSTPDTHAATVTWSRTTTVQPSAIRKQCYLTSMEYAQLHLAPVAEMMTMIVYYGYHQQ
jgi:hypothetical protein